MKTIQVTDYYGTQIKVAAALGCDQSAVSHWGVYPPDSRQLQIEKLTNGALKPEPGCLNRVMGMDKIAKQAA